MWNSKNFKRNLGDLKTVFKAAMTKNTSLRRHEDETGSFKVTMNKKTSPGSLETLKYRYMTVEPQHGDD